MSTPYLFQVEGATGSVDAGVNGWAFTVTIKLSGVAGDNDIQQLFNALTDQNVPLIGSDISDLYGITYLEGCWLRNIETVPLGDRQFRMVLSYQQSPYNTIRVSVQTQTSQVESNLDAVIDQDNPNGTPVILRYKYPDDYGGDKPTQRQLDLRGQFTSNQGGTFTKLVPETTRTYELREAIDPNTMKAYVGTMNSIDWLEVGDEKKWLLTSVTGTTDNSQQITQEWVNSYTFQYRSDDWDSEVVFVDTNTNEPVPDAVFEYPSGIGLPGSKDIVQAYTKVDFNTLFPDFGL